MSGYSSNDFIHVIEQSSQQYLDEVENISQEFVHTNQNILKRDKSNLTNVSNSINRLQHSCQNYYSKIQVTQTKIQKLKEEECRLREASEQTRIQESFDHECQQVSSAQLQLEVDAFRSCLGLEVYRQTHPQHSGAVGEEAGAGAGDAVAATSSVKRVELLFTIAAFPTVCGMVLELTEDKVYRVIQCEPRPPRLEAMVKLLNETRDIRSFLIVVRAHARAYFDKRLPPTPAPLELEAADLKEGEVAVAGRLELTMRKLSQD